MYEYVCMYVLQRLSSTEFFVLLKRKFISTSLDCVRLKWRPTELSLKTKEELSLKFLLTEQFLH